MTINPAMLMIGASLALLAGCATAPADHAAGGMTMHDKNMKQACADMMAHKDKAAADMKGCKMMSDKPGDSSAPDTAAPKAPDSAEDHANHHPKP